ncbi:MAG: hypothetical protein V7K48_23605 [Nostoc sp.]|uniref:hypothetical protein n=1 Tax=Nostoc sp. TaxID=1180 RepID=UPI002FFA56C7
MSKQIKPQMTLLHQPFLTGNTRLRREASYVIPNDARDALYQTRKGRREASALGGLRDLFAQRLR